jgi:hypothetical protein
MVVVAAGYGAQKVHNPAQIALVAPNTSATAELNLLNPNSRTGTYDQRLILQQASNGREQHIRRVALGKKAVRKFKSSRFFSAR